MDGRRRTALAAAPRGAGKARAELARLAADLAAGRFAGLLLALPGRTVLIGAAGRR